MMKPALSKSLIATVLCGTMLTTTLTASAQTPAKRLFGNKRVAAALPAAVFGSYAKGCLAGGEKLADDGPTWQAMRLSRNRHWAHPELIATVKKLTPMPDRRLSRKEREQLSATSMLFRRSNGKLTNQKLDKNRFTKAHAGIIRTAAQYGNVERIFVHPTIKRELCQQYPNKPKWLRKVRAQFGHHYHFHVRIGCPAGSPGCKPQAAVPSYGCDQATMDYWFKVAYGPPRKPKPGAKPVKPRKKREIRLQDLPSQCRVVLNASAKEGGGSIAAALAASSIPVGRIAKPSFRPVR
jgi:penicillin-insensitive murein endopeptidase